MPDQLVYFKSFEAPSLDQLDSAICNWVSSTANIIATVGPLAKVEDKYFVSLSYVAAVEGNKRG